MLPRPACRDQLICPGAQDGLHGTVSCACAL